MNISEVTNAFKIGEFLLRNDDNPNKIQIKYLTKDEIDQGILHDSSGRVYLLVSDNIYKIKLEEFFCPKQNCIFYDNQKAYFFDTQHPSYEGSIIINDLILKQINRIEASSR